MTGTARIAVTLAIFVAMVALVVIRPRRWNDAWGTTLAAAVMLALGLVTPHEAIGSVLAGKNALLFLLSLLALSHLVGKSGFFDWAAIRCAQVARGDAHALYRNAFVAGAIVTAVLSLDTTAVMLTCALRGAVRVRCQCGVDAAADQQSHQSSLRGCLPPDFFSLRGKDDRAATGGVGDDLRDPAMALSP